MIGVFANSYITRSPPKSHQAANIGTARRKDNDQSDLRILARGAATLGSVVATGPSLVYYKEKNDGGNRR